MIHGGDIYRNQVQYDFSVNINPLGIPEGVAAALHQAVEECRAYPDMQHQALKQAISEMTGVRTEDVICGNGASELFMAIMQALKPGKAVIPVPSFYGYEWAAEAAGCECIYYEMPAEQNFSLTAAVIRNMLAEIPADTRMLILANPNNPVGNVIGRKVLQELFSACQKRNILVVLDECFLEFTEEEEAASWIKRTAEFSNLIVVRAFTKLFAIPGVRLGYLVCGNEALKQKIKRVLPEWNISVFAERAGEAACRERDYREKTRQLVQTEREYMKDALRKTGVYVYDSRANFLLIQSKTALYEPFLSRGILIRDCKNFRGLKEGYYRIAIKSREENQILIQELSKIMEANK